MPEAATFEQALRAPSEKGNAQFTQWVSKLFREIAKLKSRNARVFLNPCRTHLEVRIQPNPTELSLQAFPKNIFILWNCYTCSKGVCFELNCLLWYLHLKNQEYIAFQMSVSPSIIVKLVWLITGIQSLNLAGLLCITRTWPLLIWRSSSHRPRSQ